MPDAIARDPRAQASHLLGADRVGLVLEPSPPAIAVGPWFADDPTEAPEGATDRIVSPLHAGPGSWEAVVRDEPRLTSFATDNWLAALEPIGEPPPALRETRASLTALAFNVLAPARQQANDKIGLRWTKGGFGTPFFGDDEQVRVEGVELIRQRGDHAQARRITTLRAAATFVGVEPGPPRGIEFHDPPPAPPLDEALRVDAGAVAFLDHWFGFGTLVLERLRHRAGSPPDTRVQLWAEHFDLAIELGDADRGARASYGVSPGDAVTPTPYLYVAPWTPQEGDVWDAPFGGAALSLDQLPRDASQVDAGLAFFQRARDHLG